MPGHDIIRVYSTPPRSFVSPSPDCLPQVLKTQLAAKEEGYADVVYLDAKTDTYLEEVSSCNIFTVQGKTIRTPPIEVRTCSADVLPALMLACHVHLRRRPCMRDQLRSAVC